MPVLSNVVGNLQTESGFAERAYRTDKVQSCIKSSVKNFIKRGKARRKERGSFAFFDSLTEILYRVSDSLLFKNLLFVFERFGFGSFDFVKNGIDCRCKRISVGIEEFICVFVRATDRFRVAVN